MTQVSMSTKVNYEQQKGKIIININKILKYLISTNQQKQYWLFQETKDQSRKREEAPIQTPKKKMDTSLQMLQSAKMLQVDIMQNFKIYTK